MEQLLDGIYAARKRFASIDAIGSSFLYHSGAGAAGAGGTGAGVGNDMWRYR